MIKKKQQRKGTQPASEPVSENEQNPFEELNRYLNRPQLQREDCPNLITWWGVGNFIYLTIIIES